MIDHFFFHFALLIEKLKRISVKVAYSAALMFRNVNICGSEGVLVFIGVDFYALILSIVRKLILEVGTSRKSG